MTYNVGSKVALFHFGKIEIGKILQIVKVTSSNSYYDILLERGIELNKIPERANKNSKSYIDKKITKKLNL
jgi:hypothetical protein